MIYPPLHGGLVDGHIEEVVANDGEDPVRAAGGGASGIAVLNDQQARVTIRVPHVRFAHQVLGDGAHKWKQTIYGVFELPVGVSAGETFDRELAGPQLRS